MRKKLCFSLLPFLIGANVSSNGLNKLDDGTWQAECQYREFYNLDVRCIDENGSYCFVGNAFNMDGESLDLQTLNPTEWLLMFDVDGKNKCYDVEDKNPRIV